MVHTISKLQTTQGRYDGEMEMKNKSYLRIILMEYYITLLYYMMEENLFVYVECSPVKHTASWFCHKKKMGKEKKRKESK